MVTTEGRVLTMPIIHKSQHCSNCKQEKSGMRQCSACKNALYCSKACQNQHWRQHKRQCTGLKTNKDNETVQVPLPPAHVKLTKSHLWWAGNVWLSVSWTATGFKLYGIQAHRCRSLMRNGKRTICHTRS